MSSTLPAAIGCRAAVANEAPARSAKQLISHLGRTVPFTGDATTVPATAGIGAATAGIVVGEVLGSHLERFAQREGLIVQWLRTDPTTPEESA